MGRDADQPLLTVVDIAAIAEVAHAGGARLVVDNTFATPYSSSRSVRGPMWSCTRPPNTCGGHSDVVGGFLATNDTELADRLAYLQSAIGAVGSPFDNYLTLRGLKTLAVRMDRHVRMPRRLSSFCSATTRSPMCSIPVCPITRAMLRRPGR